MNANEKLTALADEVRELSGTTTTKGLDDMKNDIDAANTEIAEQTELLGQIVAALEDKAAGGGSGSNTAGEWIPVSSLPSTLAAPPEDPGSGISTYYYEVPTNCRAVVVLYGVSYGIICKYTDDSAFSGAAAMGALTVRDADNTGTVLAIDMPASYTSSTYLLPIYTQSFMS